MARACSLKREKSPAWRGGKPRRTGNGYILVYAPWHPKQSQNFVYEHVIVAEKALGRYLPEGAEIHHVNENKADNAGRNLVICEDHAYHRLLHLRAKALKACGDPSKRICILCQKYDDVSNMKLSYYRSSYCHTHCLAVRNRKRRRTK